MKKWIGFGIISLLIVFCSYYGMGVATEKILKRNIAVLNQSNDVKVELRHYQRGWFCSHAKLKWTVSVPQSPGDLTVRRTVFPQKKTYNFDVPLDIHHGPIMWVHSKLYFGLGFAHAVAHLPTSVQKELANVYNFKSAKFEYAINVFVNYLNKTTIQFNVPQYKMTTKTGDDFFQWLGLVTDVMVSSDKQYMQGNVSLKGLSWKHEDRKGLLGPVNGGYDMHRVLDTLYIGTAHLNIPSLALFQKDIPVFRVNNLQLDSSSDIQAGLFNSSFSAKANQITVGEKVFSHYVFDLSFQNLDATVLATMNRKVSQLQSTQDKQRLLWALIPDLPALLSKGARVNLENFELNTLDGHVKMDLNLSLPNEAFTNPIQLFQKAKGESHLWVTPKFLSNWLQDTMKKTMLMQAQKKALAQEMQTPVATNAATPSNAVNPNANTVPSMTSVENPDLADSQLAAKADAKMKEWIEEGILVQEGTDYLIVVTLQNGKLFINGHPFNPTLLAV